MTACEAMTVAQVASTTMRPGEREIDIYVSGSWRYKMTVVVETPEGINA